MRCLVTGGTGFLGRHIVWRLNALGHDVVFTGRNTAHASVVLAHSDMTKGHVAFVPVAHGTSDSSRILHAAAYGTDAVVHCAALSAPWGRTANFERANVASTEEVVATCQAHGITRLVHISTPSLYFNFQNRLGIRENEALPSPVNEYARTKAIAEQFVMASNIESVIALRPRAIFGPWDDTLLPRLLRVARRTRLPLIRGGAGVIDLTYVDNVVDAVRLALGTDHSRGIFNISNGEPISIISLFEALAAAFDFEPRFRNVSYGLLDAIAMLLERTASLVPGWEPPITRYSAGLLTFSQTLDLTQAREVLGYQPRISFADGLQRTAAWFAEKGLPRQ